MTSRALAVPLLALAFALLLATACGDGDGDTRPAGRLTDPRSVPTATPWAEPPEPIILEPGALTPISESGTDGGEVNGEVGDQVTPVAPFAITTDDSVNRRESPSTESDIAGIISAGDQETVIGEVRGEPVEEGNDVWYQLEDGSFVYSGAVTRVEE